MKQNIRTANTFYPIATKTFVTFTYTRAHGICTRSILVAIIANFAFVYICKQIKIIICKYSENSDHFSIVRGQL